MHPPAYHLVNVLGCLFNREGIEEIVHLLVYSEEELEAQDRQLLESSKSNKTAEGHQTSREESPVKAITSSAT